MLALGSIGYTKLSERRGEFYMHHRGEREFTVELAFVSHCHGTRVAVYELSTTYKAWDSELAGSVPLRYQVEGLRKLREKVVADMERKFGKDFRALAVEAGSKRPSVQKDVNATTRRTENLFPMSDGKADLGSESPPTYGT